MYLAVSKPLRLVCLLVLEVVVVPLLHHREVDLVPEHVSSCNAQAKCDGDVGNEALAQLAYNWLDHDDEVVVGVEGRG